VKQKHHENGKYLYSDDLEDQTNETQTHKAKKAKVELPVINDKEVSPQQIVIEKKVNKDKFCENYQANTRSDVKENVTGTI
jgi:hypothetical protein